MENNEIIAQQMKQAIHYQEKYQNDIVIMQVIEISDKQKPLQDKDNQNVLKIFMYDIINEKNKQTYINLAHNEKLAVYMPKKHFNKYLDFYINNFTFKTIIHSNQFVGDNTETKLYVKYLLNKSVGCEHYISSCQIFCTQCNQYFFCVKCHNSQVTDHIFNTQIETKVKCCCCETEQSFTNICINCKEVFGQYICTKCKIIDDIGTNVRPAHHCEKCQQCRIGINSLSQHCDKCNCCYDAFTFTNHKCNNLDNK